MHAEECCNGTTLCRIGVVLIQYQTCIVIMLHYFSCAVKLNYVLFVSVFFLLICADLPPFLRNVRLKNWCVCWTNCSLGKCTANILYTYVEIIVVYRKVFLVFMKKSSQILKFRRCVSVLKSFWAYVFNHFRHIYFSEPIAQIMLYAELFQKRSENIHKIYFRKWRQRKYVPFLCR